MKAGGRTGASLKIWRVSSLAHRFGARSAAITSRLFDIKYLGVGGLLSCVTNVVGESAARQQPEAGFRMEMESMLVS